ncbi:hypothetical protein EVAR_45944_1 [Eumeta japonica]|uniref:Uncharacterized protein n=1 Tax=Eumeta variegata TaxID=151549 RepID=A0A4C1W8P3_EUMVA|nr:hypothetical protein EVAR_45944_1 [Eumeta japonica]
MRKLHLFTCGRTTQKRVQKARPSAAVTLTSHTLEAVPRHDEAYTKILPTTYIEIKGPDGTLHIHKSNQTWEVKGVKDYCTDIYVIEEQGVVTRDGIATFTCVHLDPPPTHRPTINAKMICECLQKPFKPRGVLSRWAR